jgi:hypothetical protein
MNSLAPALLASDRCLQNRADIIVERTYFPLAGRPLAALLRKGQLLKHPLSSCAMIPTVTHHHDTHQTDCPYSKKGHRTRLRNALDTTS